MAFDDWRIVKSIGATARSQTRINLLAPAIRCGSVVFLCQFPRPAGVFGDRAGG